MHPNPSMKTKAALAILAVLAASAVVPAVSMRWWYPKITVHVINGLQPGSPVLSLHCKSGDDDLGFKQLGKGEEFKWSFSKNFLQTTKFWCTFWWDSNLIELVVYDAVYDQMNDTPQLCYKANEQGVVMSYDHKRWSDPYLWGYSDWSLWTKPPHFYAIGN